MKGSALLKVVVVSDTHMPRMAKTLPSVLVKDLQTADLIIHAGDWQTLDAYHLFSKYTSVVGVYGNVDDEEVRRQFNEKEIIHIGYYTIGLTHGHGTKKTTEERALETFGDEKVHCIIFGHSHIPVLKSVNGVLLFNPGSATDKRRQSMYSYGIITIDDELRCEHVFYQSKS